MLFRKSPLHQTAVLMTTAVEVEVQSQFEHGSAVDIVGNRKAFHAVEKLLAAAEGNHVFACHARIVHQIPRCSKIS